jgi:UPF0755 protein
MAMNRRTRSLMFPKLGKISILIFGVLLLITGFRAFQLYGYVFSPNVTREVTVQIPTGATYSDVLELIEQHDFIKNMKAFKWVAKKKKYPELVKPGQYTFKKGMNSNQVINTLRSGNQTPVDLTFNNVRFRTELAGRVASYIEADSVAVLALLDDAQLAAKYGFTYQTFPTMFIPNTYQIYWTTSPETFVERMHREYKTYWNDDRKKKAEQLGLTPVEVAVLASIVQEETAKNDEKPRVAGVYLNRIKMGMPLQADPTVKFALGDFSIRRVSRAMLTTDSPYNTYKYAGLPPGPICFPEISSLNSVLNSEEHKYLFFCAKEDFSGYHNFATTLAEHNRNASRYQQALNRLKIWR